MLAFSMFVHTNQIIRFQLHTMTINQHVVHLQFLYVDQHQEFDPGLAAMQILAPITSKSQLTFPDTIRQPICHVNKLNASIFQDPSPHLQWDESG